MALSLPAAIVAKAGAGVSNPWGSVGPAEGCGVTGDTGRGGGLSQAGISRDAETGEVDERDVNIKEYPWPEMAWALMARVWIPQIGGDRHRLRIGSRRKTLPHPRHHRIAPLVGS